MQIFNPLKNFPQLLIPFDFQKKKKQKLIIIYIVD